jgi:hypothetical protein
VAHRVEPIPVAGRGLKVLLLGSCTHLLLELSLDRPRLAREELDHALDDLAVILLRDVADARGQAAFDVVVEARDPRMPARLRPFAGPVREDAVEDVEGLAHLLRVRVRPEVDDPAAMSLAGEHDARVVVLHGHRDVRIGLVVAQADVERRPVAADEVLLEMEGLRLVRGDDHLDPLDPLREVLEPRPRVTPTEVRAHARAQGLRLSHVEDGVLRPAEEVHARLRRDALQLRLDALRAAFCSGGHACSSLAWGIRPPGRR